MRKTKKAAVYDVMILCVGPTQTSRVQTGVETTFRGATFTTFPFSLSRFYPFSFFPLSPFLFFTVFMQLGESELQSDCSAGAYLYYCVLLCVYMGGPKTDTLFNYVNIMPYELQTSDIYTVRRLFNICY